MKNATVLCICFIILFVFQSMYWKMCDMLTGVIHKGIPHVIGYQYDIIGHGIAFLTLFLITFPLQMFGKCDFGYHKVKAKVWVKCLGTILAIYLVFSFIDALFGVRRQISMELLWWLLFQLLFSGLGEEIIFRSVPIKILDSFGKGHTLGITVFRVKIDLSVMLSSLLFLIAHIDVYMNNVWYACIYGLVFVFIGGTIDGVIYRKTKSIWVAMAAHGLSNCIMIVFPVIFAI